MRGADARQQLVVARASACDGAIGDDRHVMPAAGGYHLRLVEKGMAFDLIADQRLGRKLGGFLEKLDREIRHADVAGEPVALDLAQRAERVGKRNLWIGPMEQQ